MLLFHASMTRSFLFIGSYPFQCLLIMWLKRRQYGLLLKVCPLLRLVVVFLLCGCFMVTCSRPRCSGGCRNVRRLLEWSDFLTAFWGAMEEMNYLEIANSTMMWIAAGLAVAVVLVQAFIFSKKSYSTSLEMGLTREQMNGARATPSPPSALLWPCSVRWSPC